MVTLGPFNLVVLFRLSTSQFTKTNYKGIFFIASWLLGYIIDSVLNRVSMVIAIVAEYSMQQIIHT